MFNDFFLNIIIIGTFLLLSGYIFRRSPSGVDGAIKIKIIAGLGIGHLGVLLMSYPIHLGQNGTIDLSHLAIYMIAIYAGLLSTIITALVLILYRFFMLGFTPAFLVFSGILIAIAIIDGIIIKMNLPGFKKSIYINVFNVALSTI